MDAASVPRFKRGVRLREDAARGRWVVLAPERAFVPDGTALEVLKLVDGARSVVRQDTPWEHALGDATIYAVAAPDFRFGDEMDVDSEDVRV